MASIKNVLSACVASFYLVAASTGAYASDSPFISLDSNGNGAATWFTYNMGGNSIIQANTFVSSAWGTTPATISSVSDNVFGPKIAVITNTNSQDPDISAVAIWGQQDPLTGNMSMYAAMLPSAQSGVWTNAARISSGAESAISTSEYFIRADSNGNVLAVWAAVDASGNEYIWSNTSQINATNSWNSLTSISGP